MKLEKRIQQMCCSARSSRQITKWPSSSNNSTQWYNYTSGLSPTLHSSHLLSRHRSINKILFYSPLSPPLLHRPDPRPFHSMTSQKRLVVGLRRGLTNRSTPDTTALSLSFTSLWYLCEEECRVVDDVIRSAGNKGGRRGSRDVVMGARVSTKNGENKIK